MEGPVFDAYALNARDAYALNALNAYACVERAWSVRGACVERAWSVRGQDVQGSAGGVRKHTLCRRLSPPAPDVRDRSLHGLCMVFPKSNS
jgi:hypothetical protein